VEKKRSKALMIIKAEIHQHILMTEAPHTGTASAGGSRKQNSKYSVLTTVIPAVVYLFLFRRGRNNESYNQGHEGLAILKGASHIRHTACRRSQRQSLLYNLSTRSYLFSFNDMTRSLLGTLHNSGKRSTFHEPLF